MDTQYYIEIIGTGFFAISGALAAHEKSKPDWFGTTIIGFITSLGGGSTRDIILGQFPLGWIKDDTYIYSIFIGIIVASVFYPLLIKLRKSLFLFDTLGIAVFTILGTIKSLEYTNSPFAAAILGMFSAIMGGVLRDVLTNEIPVLFRKEIYASACLTGAFLFLLLNHLGVNKDVNLFVSILAILTARIAGVIFDISLPQFRK